MGWARCLGRDAQCLTCLELVFLPACLPQPAASLPPVLRSHMQAGIGWRPAGNGSPVLESAIAHMECRVVSRMETPDHWICYAEVEEGEVTKPEARTAVHRRKVASYY